MNIVLTLSFLFLIGSLLGWLLELFFRRFFSQNNPEKKWINPGFLVGPYLPLYGLGLCLLYLLAGLEKYSIIQNPIANKILLFVFMTVCMTIIELIAGEIFIIGMKVKLWDYSDQKWNYKGIICPRFSAFWAILGAVYYFLIHPHILRAVAWLASNLAFSFFIGMFYGVFLIDLVYSTKLVIKIKRIAEEYRIVVRYEELKKHMQAARESGKEKARFFLTLHSNIPLTTHIREFINSKMKRNDP